MNAYPFFSVVIPTYNRAAFIEATLESVFSQTYPHYEIIIVDNCSTDNTDEVLEPYIRAGRIQFVKHEQNYERARSRNTGMRMARGDFVTLLDSDDFMYPENLADASAFALAHPEIKCFQNLYELVDSHRKVLRNFPLPSLDNQLRAIAEGNFMSCIGNFIHREIYQRYQFDTTPELTGAEDWEFWLRVLADYRLGRIEKINSGVRHHEGRSVNNQNLQNYEIGVGHLCGKLIADSHLSEVYRPYLKRIQSNSVLYMAILANGGGRFKEAKKYLRQALTKDLSLLLSGRFWRVARRALLRLQSS